MDKIIAIDQPTLAIDMTVSRKELESYELIRALLSYTEDLEAIVLDLRQEVNNLTPPGQQKPYESIHSDIYEAFDDYPAYQRYMQLFKGE